MDLKFIGIGSAFNTELGNTSAYIKKQDSLFLIDCGSLIFHQLTEQSLIQNIRTMYVAITHTHPDHVSSLAEAIFYCYYILKIKVKVIFRDEETIRTLLKLVGATEEMYELVSTQHVVIEDEALGKLELLINEVPHVDTLTAYSFLIGDEKEWVYYSGDANSLPQEIVHKLANGEITRIYQDTCGIDYPGNAHYYIGHLEKQIPQELRDKVYCMHFDKHVDREDLRRKGFKTVEVSNKEEV